MFQKLREWWKSAQEAAHHLEDRAHKAHSWCHLSYFSAVFLEGHGVYALTAGVLGVFVLLSIIGGGDGE